MEERYQVVSLEGCKCKGKMEVADNDQHAGLLCYSINYSCKKFSSRGPCFSQKCKGYSHFPIKYSNLIFNSRKRQIRVKCLEFFLSRSYKLSQLLQHRGRALDSSFQGTGFESSHRCQHQPGKRVISQSCSQLQALKAKANLL